MSTISTISTISIEDVIKRIRDLEVVTSNVNKYLEKKFIENFNNEYVIIKKGTTNIKTTNTDDILSMDKGEMIDFCLKNDKKLKEIDCAIPLVISKELSNFGLDRSYMVTAYWKNGEIEILNILQHFITIKKSL